MSSFDSEWFLLCLIPLLIAIGGLFYDNRKKRWHTTQGIVTEARYKATNPNGAYCVCYFYRFIISYKYKVKNQTFYGKCKLPMGESATSETEAEELLNTIYAKDEPIDVYFDPRKAFSSSLHKKIRSFWFTILYGGIIALLPLLGSILYELLY